MVFLVRLYLGWNEAESMLCYITMQRDTIGLKLRNFDESANLI